MVRASFVLCRCRLCCDARPTFTSGPFFVCGVCGNAHRQNLHGVEIELTVFYRCCQLIVVDKLDFWLILNEISPTVSQSAKAMTPIGFVAAAATSKCLWGTLVCNSFWFSLYPPTRVAKSLPQLTSLSKLLGEPTPPRMNTNECYPNTSDYVLFIPVVKYQDKGATTRPCGKRCNSNVRDSCNKCIL